MSKDFICGMKNAISNIDGASRGNPGDASYGVIINFNGKKYVLKNFLGIATNNEAEYEALLAVLNWAFKNKIEFLKVFSDSKLLVEQIKGKYKVRSENLKKLHQKAIEDIKKIPKFQIYYIKREFNKEADKVANECLDENL